MSKVTSKDGTAIAFDTLGKGPAVIVVEIARWATAIWGLLGRWYLFCHRTSPSSATTGAAGARVATRSLM